MMERLIRKKARLAERYREDIPVLLLDEGASSRALNRKKAAASGLKANRIKSILQSVEFLQKRRLPGSGKPLLTDRRESSDLVWREFLRQQVRYDLVLTNALVFPDDLRVPARFRGSLGQIRMRIGPAEGRTGMEGRAAYISLYEPSEEASGRSGDRPNKTRNIHDQDLNAVLLSLILPAPAEAFTTASGGGLLPDCAGCPNFWKRRLGYLRGMAHIHRANFTEGCPLLRANRPVPEQAPRFLRMDKDWRVLADKNHELLLRKCPKP